MALTFTTNQTGASPDYAKYLGSNPVKHDKLNQPDLLNFTLIPFGAIVSTGNSFLLESSGKLLLESSGYLISEISSGVVGFVKLTRGTRIVLSSGTYANWFTGYITNDPSLSYLGTANNIPQWGYVYEATDDSYILNLKPVGLIPPFINTTSGAIIKQMVRLLDVDSSFDVSGIGVGISVSRYIVDPNKKFTEILQDFTDPMAYRWRWPMRRCCA